MLGPLHLPQRAGQAWKQGEQLHRFRSISIQFWSTYSAYSSNPAPHNPARCKGLRAPAEARTLIIRPSEASRSCVLWRQTEKLCEPQAK